MISINIRMKGLRESNVGGRNIKPIRVEVSISVPPDLVWRAWTQSERITAWFAPEAIVEARCGGPFELFFDPSDHEHQCTKGCVFTLVEPMRCLGFTWRGPDQFAGLMNDPSSLTSVTVNFSDEDRTSRVVIEHRGWGEGKDWARAWAWHQKAWETVLGRLKSALESGKSQLHRTRKGNES